MVAVRRVFWLGRGSLAAPSAAGSADLRTTPGGASRILLANAPAPTGTWGGELLARFVRELGEGGAHDDDEPPALRITATYTYLRATECDPLHPLMGSVHSLPAAVWVWRLYCSRVEQGADMKPLTSWKRPIVAEEKRWERVLVGRP